MTPPEPPGTAAAAFAATEAIRTGAWDRYLLTLHLALRQRLTDADFKRQILANAEIRAAGQDAGTGLKTMIKRLETLNDDGTPR